MSALMTKSHLAIIDGIRNGTMRPFNDTFLPATNPYCHPQPPTLIIQFVSYQIILPIMVLIGLIGNVMVFKIFRSFPIRPSFVPVRLYILGLVIADINLLLLTLYTQFIRQFFNIMNNGLKVAYALSHFFRTVSMWTSVLIAVDRWLAIRYPLHHQTTRTLRRARQSLAVVLFLSFGYCLPRFFDFDLKPVKSCVDNSTVMMAESSLMRSSQAYSTVYLIVCYTIFMMLVPFFIILILNLLIYKQLRKALNHRGRMSWSQISQEHSTTIMLSFEALVFLMCNSLPVFLNVIEIVFKGYSFTDYIVTRLVYVNNLLVVLNSATNFFVFYAFGSKFRQVTRQYYSKHRESALRRFSMLPSLGGPSALDAVGPFTLVANNRRHSCHNLISNSSLLQQYRPNCTQNIVNGKRRYGSVISISPAPAVGNGCGDEDKGICLIKEHNGYSLTVITPMNSTLSRRMSDKMLMVHECDVASPKHKNGVVRFPSIMESEKTPSVHKSDVML